MSPSARIARPRARVRPARAGLREQLRAASRELPARQKKQPQPAAPCAEPSFEELAEGVKRLPRTPARAAESLPEPAPAAPGPIAAAPRRRLYVEQRGSGVRARAPGVPVRWLEALEAGRLVPRTEVDLHRKTAAEARQAIVDGVREARRAGIGCLLVVCGRGRHSSKTGPVLPDVAVECLSETLASEVLAFTSAPRKWGGRGALIVRLRPA